MGGIRIKHRDLRNCVVTVPLPGQRLPHNPEYGHHGKCPTCGMVHVLKTYHLNLDDAGQCVVSPKVFSEMCKANVMDGHGGVGVGLPGVPFEFVEDEPDPPPLTIGLPGPSGGGSLTDGEGRVIRAAGDGMPVVSIHEDYD